MLQVNQQNYYYLWINQPCRQWTSKISPHSRVTLPTSGCFWVWSKRFFSASCSASATTSSSITSPATIRSASSSCKRPRRTASALSWNGCRTCSAPPISSSSRRTISPFIRILQLSKLQRCFRLDCLYLDCQPWFSERIRSPQRFLPIHQ